jgi:hypothetical protein
MRLSDLLNKPVLDAAGRRVGYVLDVRLVQDGPVLAETNASFRLHDLLVGPHRVGARLGYERADLRGPGLLKAIFSRVHARDESYAWDRIASIEEDCVRLRPG